jgi:hypothetical protein
MLRYVEPKSGHSDNGPAWIGYVTPSKTGRTVYFNGRALGKFKGQQRDECGGNYCDIETGESFWVSGVKKNGEDRHWAGSGKVLIEAAAVSEYLETIGASAFKSPRYEVTHSIVPTDIGKLEKLANQNSDELLIRCWRMLLEKSSKRSRRSLKPPELVRTNSELRKYFVE